MAGLRTVPVEVGKHYVSDAWAQKLMPLADFIELYVNEVRLLIPNISPFESIYRYNSLSLNRERKKQDTLRRLSSSNRFPSSKEYALLLLLIDDLSWRDPMKSLRISSLPMIVILRMSSLPIITVNSMMRFS